MLVYLSRYIIKSIWLLCSCSGELFHRREIRDTDTVRDMLKETCVDYGLKENEEQKLITKQSEQTDDTLERLEESWSALL